MLTDILIAAGWTRDRAAGCWYAPGDHDTARDCSEAREWLRRHIAAGLVVYVELEVPRA